MKRYVRETILKTIAWRIIATALSFLVVFLMTKKIETATIITIVVMGSNTVAYFIFELLWDKLIYKKKKK